MMEEAQSSPTPKRKDKNIPTQYVITQRKPLQSAVKKTEKPDTVGDERLRSYLPSSTAPQDEELSVGS